MFSTAFADTAIAQGTITIPSGPLIGGSSIPIKYSDPSKAGQTVHVKITDNKDVEGVDIQLNADGYGEAQWTVPSTWKFAFFSADGAASVGRTVKPPEPNN